MCLRGEMGTIGAGAVQHGRSHGVPRCAVCAPIIRLPAPARYTLHLESLLSALWTSGRFEIMTPCMAQSCIRCQEELDNTLVTALITCSLRAYCGV